MKPGIEKLKRKFNDEPVQMLIVGALAITAVAKLIDAVSAAQGRHAYARQVDYRINR